MVRSRTIVMPVSRTTGDVFDAILSAPAKMVSDAKKHGSDAWSFSTPRGQANLKFKPNKTYGILDYLYEDDEAKWEVPMRVVPSGNESEVIVTVSKPEILSDQQFDERMKELEEMFQNLKQIIETN